MIDEDTDILGVILKELDRVIDVEGVELGVTEAAGDWLEDVDADTVTVGDNDGVTDGVTVELGVTVFGMDCVMVDDTDFEDDKLSDDVID